MTDYKEMPLLGNGIATLTDALRSLGFEVGLMNGPMHKIPDGPTITAMAFKYSPDVHTVLGLANQIIQHALRSGGDKIWLYQMDNDARRVRYALTDSCGNDLSLPKVQDKLAKAERPAQKEATKPREFINHSDNEFTDISSEASRTYNFGQRGFVKINNPLYVSVSSSGGHRLFSADGTSHYVPSGWIQISFVAKEGQPNFVK